MNLSGVLDLLPDTDKNVVSVLSGGLDSSVMTYLLVRKYGNDRVSALSYNYHQKQVLELEKAAATCAHLNIKHKILDLSILGEIVQDVSANISGTTVAMPTIKDVLGDPTPKTYVPFRNMILNSLAFSYAEASRADYIFSGLQSTDLYGYWDTSPAFVERMNAVASLSRDVRPKLVAPFGELTKADEIAIAIELGGVQFENTLTCYNPDEDGRSCATCPSCSERIQAFMKNKMVDPIAYQKNIAWKL